jgi:hypothetical protein
MLPDNPCEVLTKAEVASATGLDVREPRRVPNITKVVQAQRSHIAPEPGRICVFDTMSRFGAINIAVLPKAERRGKYWEARTRYFQTFPGSARVVSELGEDAWLAGGADLHVLLGGDEYVIISAQYYQPEARTLLVELARTIVNRFR